MAFKKKELSIFECDEVVDAWKFGISKRKTSKTLNHPKISFYDVISAYKNCGYETLSLKTDINGRSVFDI
ncbi:2151_t:CDS:2 [Funneliformis mosseae]|uniref:2151_t:CDS:1 n=1 Tax=Funneliformis mosseae TaxID=27381 RepID=A0A9N9BWE5_FUNMO|nr:2151_t:CDS:2 [Funneliformis mosseae]